jgi:DegV family protein with EDD domain
MAVKVVTDSSSDIPPELAKELGIHVVPLYTHFGNTSYRDEVDISADEIYSRMQSDPNLLTTSAASPGGFASVYNQLSENSDGIISIHLSGKLSATFNAAQRAREMITNSSCPVEVIDSKLVTIALGLVTLAAARSARTGDNLQTIVQLVNKIIPTIRTYGFLDTLQYIAKSGRLGKAGSLLSSVLPIKPILTIKDGSLLPAGIVRTRSKGLERLLELIKSTQDVCEIGISHSSEEGEVQLFIEKIRSFLPDIKPIVSKLGPALGVHGGPGAILVAMRQHINTKDIQLEAEPRKRAGNFPSLQNIKDGILQRRQKDHLSFSNHTINSFAL